MVAEASQSARDSMIFAQTSCGCCSELRRSAGERRVPATPDRDLLSIRDQLIDVGFAEFQLDNHTTQDHKGPQRAIRASRREAAGGGVPAARSASVTAMSSHDDPPDDDHAHLPRAALPAPLEHRPRSSEQPLAMKLFGMLLPPAVQMRLHPG